MPEVNNIPSSLSYRPADPAEPVLDISIGDALRAATSTWRTRSALIDGTSEKQTRRRWTFEELLAESEKVARALLRFVSGEHVTIWAANGPQPVFSTSMARWSRAARSASYGSTAPTSLSAIGDLMRQGEGDDLWFVSRKKDLIIRGGSNIGPAEVERVLKTTSGRCVSRSFDEHFRNAEFKELTAWAIRRSRISANPSHATAGIIGARGCPRIPPPAKGCQT